MGANVAAEKSPRSTSRLKNTPPMGALKTAAIPPAAPHATKLRMRPAETLRNWPTAEPMAAPICAMGASRPTEPPEPIVTADATVRIPTVRGLRMPPWRAMVSMALGTPSPLASLGNRWISGPIRSPPSIGIRNRNSSFLPEDPPVDLPEKDLFEEMDGLQEHDAAQAGERPDHHGHDDVEDLVAYPETLESAIDFPTPRIRGGLEPLPKAACP